MAASLTRKGEQLLSGSSQNSNVDFISSRNMWNEECLCDIATLSDVDCWFYILCAYICIHVHACTCVCICVWNPDVNLDCCSSQHCPICMVRLGLSLVWNAPSRLSLVWNSPSRLGWLPSKPQTSSCLYLSNSGIVSQSKHTQIWGGGGRRQRGFFMGSWNWIQAPMFAQPALYLLSYAHRPTILYFSNAMSQIKWSPPAPKQPVTQMVVAS